MTALAPTRILLAVGSPGLLRVIEHLLRELPGVEITTSQSAAAVLADAFGTAPDVIVTSARLLGSPGPSVAELRRLCPRSKLVFITDGLDWVEDAREASADASLEEEDLVTSLVPIVHALAVQ
jgi:DNA-binding NarL/FixJ family response regulator